MYLGSAWDVRLPKLYALTVLLCAAMSEGGQTVWDSLSGGVREVEVHDVVARETTVG